MQKHIENLIISHWRACCVTVLAVLKLGLIILTLFPQCETVTAFCFFYHYIIQWTIDIINTASSDSNMRTELLPTSHQYSRHCIRPEQHQQLFPIFPIFRLWILHRYQRSMWQTVQEVTLSAKKRTFYGLLSNQGKFISKSISQHLSPCNTNSS